MKNNARMRTTGDIIVDALIKMGKPLTVKNWVSLNYWDRTLEDLEGEYLVEVLDLVERGLLVDTQSERVS